MTVYNFLNNLTWCSSVCPNIFIVKMCTKFPYAEPKPSFCGLQGYLCLNAELNPICHLLALLGAHPILHVSRIRVNYSIEMRAFDSYIAYGRLTCTSWMLNVNIFPQKWRRMFMQLHHNGLLFYVLQNVPFITQFFRFCRIWFCPDAYIVDLAWRWSHFKRCVGGINYIFSVYGIPFPLLFKM
jgi:hypothetical protein